MSDETPLGKAIRESEENIYNFQDNLKNLINRHSIDNMVDMQDFLLAEMLIGVIRAMGKAHMKSLDLKYRSKK